MARSDRRLRRYTFTVGASLTLGVLAVHLFTRWLDPVEGGLYDARAQLCQSFTPKPTDKIVHVDIDDAALEAMGAWPWPRTLMADLVGEMSAAGAKAIALDVLYTEPQEKRWEPDQKQWAGPPPAAGEARAGTFRLVDHDANLAAAFRSAGNVMLPASLLFVPAHPQTPAMTSAVKRLTDDLELTREQLVAAVRAEGLPEADVAGVESVYFDLRREAARVRAERELDKTAAPTATMPAAIEPATAAAAPATGPATRPSDADPAAFALRSAVRRALFPHHDPLLESPETRVADEAMDHVRAARALARFGRPPAPGASAFVARNQILPVPVLLESAAASGYVDYPNVGDGTVRTVPLMMQHAGRWYLQMGLRVACQMLEVDPADLAITPTGITIPAGTLRDGTPRPALTVPVRTVTRQLAGGRTVEFPLVMDIPWFGGRQWYAMYDPTKPSLKAQHLPLSVVYDAVRTRRKVDDSVAGADRAARYLLGFVDEALKDGKNRLAAYERDPFAEADATPAKLATALAEVEALIPPETTEADAGGDARVRQAIVSAASVRAARDQLPLLRTQWAAQRAELRKVLGGKAAILGWTAVASVADQKPTPLHAAAPGVVIHGVIANAVLTGDLWRAAPPWVTVVLVLGLGLLTTAAVAFLAPTYSFAVAVGLAVACAATNGYLLFDYGNVIVDLAAPLLAVGGPWAGGVATRLIIEQRERVKEARLRKRIVERLGSYVDPALVDYVLQEADETVFSGQRKETTVVFTDLEGFTTLSEKLGEAVVPLLNDFMGRATAVINRHNGFVNKFLGDGILFFFNAPRPNAAFVPDAMDAILDLQVMMVQYNADLAAKDLPRLRLRAGATTGFVIAGDAGDAKRHDYTVLGDLVNLAARLESANKFFGTSNLVTEQTAERAGDGYLFRPVGVIQVVGRKAGERVYEALGWAKDATDQQRAIATLSKSMFDAFTAGRANDCLLAVNALEATAGASKLTKMYRERCEPYANGTAEGEMPREIVLAEK